MNVALSISSGRVTRISTRVAQSVLLSLFVVIGINSVEAQTTSQTSSKTKIIRRQGTGPEASVERKKARAAKAKPAAPEKPTADAAQTELIIPADARSRDVLPTPATVLSKIEPVQNPLGAKLFEIGLSAQMYQPMGRVELPTLTPYELDGLSAKPMLALELRWLPLDFEMKGAASFGLFGSVGYAQHRVNLTSPTGLAIENTELHSLKTQAGAELGWSPSASSLWGVRGLLGYGQLLVTQSSNSAFASMSGTVRFASVGATFERKFFDRWTAYAGYDYRIPVQNASTQFDIQKSNIVAGILGGFQ